MASPVTSRTVLSSVTVLPPDAGSSDCEMVVGNSISGPQISRLATSTAITAAALGSQR